MPPKRKQPDTSAAAETTTTRATRSSTRAKSKKEDKDVQPVKKKAPAKKKAPTPVDDDDDEDDEEIEAPPAKKPRTKAPAKPKRAKKAPTKAQDDDEPLIVNNADDQAGPSKPVAAPPPVETKKQPIVKPEPYSPLRAAELFTNYADADEPNVIGSEGLEKICTEADIPMDGALPILLSWQLNAQEMGKLEKSGWLKWTADRKISSLSAIKIALEELNALVVDGKPPIKKPAKQTDEPYDRTEYCLFAENPKDAFHKLYFYSFTLVKPPQSRNIEMDTAKAFWAVLLTPKYVLMNEVLEFINGREESYKAVNKDLWGMMLEFCETMNPNLDGYEADGAWPTLLDEFVAHKKGESKSD